MQNPDIGESSVAPDTESDGGRSNYSIASLKQRPGSALNFLAEGFVPSENDVVCGRGKKCYSHAGNERFKTRVMGVLDEYSKAKSKLDKSGVLNRVVAEVRRASPGGGFVKQDDSGRWYEVGDFLAREKTSQAFRDALHERYKSSNVSKKKRRKEVLMKFSDKSQMMQNYSEDEGRSKIELSTSIFSQNAVGAQQRLRPFPHSLQQQTNQSNSDLTPAFSVPRNYPISSTLPPRGPPSYEFNTRDAFANRSFSGFSSHHPGRAFPVDTAPFAPNQHAFPLVFEDDGTATNFRSLPDMRYDIHASIPSFQEQMHHSLPNLHFNCIPEATGNILAVATQYETQLNAFRNPAATDRHHAQQPNPAFSLEFEPEFVSPPQRMDPEAPLVDRKPAKKSSTRDDHELLQCLDKLTGYKLSDDNPYEPVPIGTNKQNPP